MRYFVGCAILSGYILFLPRPSYSIPVHSLPPALAAADTDYYYEPVPGKVIGVWPDLPTTQRLALLRQEYGFSGVVLAPDVGQYNSALAAGFPSSSIMMRVWDENYNYAVDNFPAGIYYLDEPVEHDCAGHPSGSRLYTPEELALRRDYVHTHRPSAQFVIGGYKRCSHNQIGATYADRMMYSAYRDWVEFGFPVCHVNMGWGDDWESPWVPQNDDQRNSWTSMRNTFGTKFSMTWIHGGGDEYALLFAHANSLGLTGIWQFNLTAIDSARLESFCYAAWQNGWLERVARLPLPIQLSSFTATVTSQRTVLLRWVTLSELNNYGFEVQRRAENVLGFGTLPNSFIPGHGTTTEPHTYSFTDGTPLERCRYRLKQIDLDGTVHFGPEVSIGNLTGASEKRERQEEIDLYQNYPNPFNPATVIKISLSQSTHATLKIYDLLGREAAALVDDDLEAGRHEFQWDASGFAAGVYWCKLTAGSTSHVRKLVILK